MVISGKRSDTIYVEAAQSDSSVFDDVQHLHLVNGNSDEPGWWLLNIDVAEFAADTNAAPITLPGSGTFEAAPRRSSIFAKVAWSVSARDDCGHAYALNGRRVRFDLGGGGRWSFYATNVQVSVFAATNLRVREYPESSGADSIQAPRVTFTQVSGSIEPQCQTLGPQFGSFTNRLSLPGGTAPTAVPIPEDATHVQVYRASGSGAAVAWEFLGFTGDPLGVFPVGTSVAVPGPANFLRATGGAVGGPTRAWTIVFEQRW